MSIIEALKGFLGFRSGVQPEEGHITLVYRSNGEAVILHDSLSGSDHIMAGVASLWDEQTSGDLLKADDGLWDDSTGDGAWTDDAISGSLFDDDVEFSSFHGCYMENESDSSMLLVNPCTGLPMIDDAIDVGGNPYGMCTEIDMGDTWSTCGDSFDDPF